MMLAMLTLFLPVDFYPDARRSPNRSTCNRGRHVVGPALAWLRRAASQRRLCSWKGQSRGERVDLDGGESGRVGASGRDAVVDGLRAGAIWPRCSWDGREPRVSRDSRLPVQCGSLSGGGPVLLLFVLNGLAPYLGFQTVRTMSMFSNIRTEGDRTNHMLIPSRAFRSRVTQDDLVRLDRVVRHLAGRLGRQPKPSPVHRAPAPGLGEPGVSLSRSRMSMCGRVRNVLDTSSSGAERQVPPLPFPLHKNPWRSARWTRTVASPRCLW